MSGYIIVDTEGTGLFQHSKMVDGVKVTKRSDEPGQPRMAQYGHVLVDSSFNVEAEYSQYVLPVGWQNEDGTPVLEMPQKAFEVHGLSMDFLREHGRDVRHCLERYEEAIKRGRVLIGYNQQHDGRQIRAELRHAGRDDLFDRTPNICAMRSITANYKGEDGKCAVKKLNRKGGHPRLIDAAAHFGIPYPEEDRHDGMRDARVTAKVAERLHEMGLLLPAEVHYSRNMPQGEQS